MSLIDRRVRKVANARFLTLSLAVTFVICGLIGAIVIWLFDRHDFPSLGLALWWSIQTVTTVGYGDVVPKTVVGRLIGGVELVVGVSFVAFLTAGVTSTVIQREESRAKAADNARREQEAQAILASMAALDKRLDGIESKLPQLS